MLDADPLIDKTAPSIHVKEAVAKLRGGKAAGICNISAELLKAGGEATIRGLHAVLTTVWLSSTIPPDWKRGWSSLSGREKGTIKIATTIME